MNMISIVIPTINAGTQFSALLDALDCQTTRPRTILIVDCGSSDDTVEIAKSYGCKVLRIDKNKFDHGTTRNLAMAEVSSEFVVFLTQDAIPADENMIAELIKPMQADSNIAICYGRQLSRPDARTLERFAREFNYPDKSLLKTKNDIKNLGLKTFFCSNSCAAYRRSIFEKHGGFENGVGTNEDMLFAVKAILAGYSVYYAAQAKVYHSHNYRIFDLWLRYFKIGRFFKQYRDVLSIAPLKNEGITFFKAGLRHFAAKKQWGTAIRFCLQTGIKFVAFKLGKL